MKSLLSALAVAFVCVGSFSCVPTEDSPTSSGSGSCTHNGHKLYVGPQGGCYYIKSNGNQTYVDRSEVLGVIDDKNSTIDLILK